MEDGKRTHQGSKKGLSGADFAGVGLQFAFAIIVFLYANSVRVQDVKYDLTASPYYYNIWLKP